MKQCLIFLVLAVSVLQGVTAMADSHRPERINIGYFLQVPTPAMFAQDKMSFDRALGIDINWVRFDSGIDMNQAMAAGELQIAYAQGLVPFLVGVSGGLDLTMVGIALENAESDNCIVRGGAGIARANAGDLAGRKVAVRTGSLSHFRLLGVLKHLGVDSESVEIVSVPDGRAAAAALENGEVVMACASGSALRRMQGMGNSLMSGAEQSAIGLKLFDSITVPSEFANRHADIVQAFMDIVAASNQQWETNSRVMLRSIARAADMDQESARRALQAFEFPSVEEQKSDPWLGGQVADYSKELADFFVAHGQLQRAQDNYERFVTTRFLR